MKKLLNALFVATIVITSAVHVAADEIIISSEDEYVISDEENCVDVVSGDDMDIANGASIVSSGECGANLTYTLNSDVVLKISGTGEMYPCDFSGVAEKYVVKKVIIENGATNIGASDFYEFKDLVEVDIPNSVKSIDAGAFDGCVSLESINIPGSVTNIVFNPFERCGNLGTITVDADNPNYDSRGNCNAIIKKADNTLVVGGKNTVISNDIKSVAKSAFSGCTGLENIVIPDSVTSIGDYAFSDCSNLLGIEFPAGIKK